jgi:hypothetical protein
MSVTTPYGLSTKKAARRGAATPPASLTTRRQDLPMANANPTADDARVAANMTDDELADALDLAVMHIDQARRQRCAANLAELEAEERALRAEAARRWGS